MNDALIESLHRAVEAAPDDLTRRLYLAELLVGAGRGDEAVTYLGLALASEPGTTKLRSLMARAVGAAPAFDLQGAEADFGDVVPPVLVDGQADETDEPSRREGASPTG
jgi:predicted Zn-dependent protease